MKKIFIFALVLVWSQTFGLVVPSQEPASDITYNVVEGGFGYGGGDSGELMVALLVPTCFIGFYMLADQDEGNDYWGYALILPSAIVLYLMLN